MLQVERLFYWPLPTAPLAVVVTLVVLIVAVGQLKSRMFKHGFPTLLSGLAMAYVTYRLCVIEWAYLHDSHVPAAMLDVAIAFAAFCCICITNGSLAKTYSQILLSGAVGMGLYAVATDILYRLEPQVGLAVLLTQFEVAALVLFILAGAHTKSLRSDLTKLWHHPS